MVWLSSMALTLLIAQNSFALEPPSAARQPTQLELTNLLTGNTIDGKWAGRPFRQFFDKSGSTKYREGKGSVSFGTWRVNASGRYCSVWPPSPSEACYEVLVDGKNIYWKSGGEVYPSSVSSGDVF